jgi:competence protein ComEA
VFDPDRRHLIAYLAAAAVLVVIAARFVGRDSGSAPVPQVSMAAPASANPARARSRAKPVIWVDVAGAVRRPGLYSLPDGARVAAALERAGGVGRRADRAAVNLAAKLTDGQQVFVPVRGAVGGGAAGAAGSRGGAAGAAGPGGGASTSGAPGTSGGASGGGASATSGGAASAGARVSLSTATQAQLEQLDGIGPALAQRIIDYREQNGGFKSIDQLQEVSGIGEKRFEALKDSIAP